MEKYLKNQRNAWDLEPWILELKKKKRVNEKMKLKEAK